jgi:uncharacterized Fe-S radical SAM superfamily protein PflX
MFLLSYMRSQACSSPRHVLLSLSACLSCLQYLPDFKFWTPESSQRYAKAKDYPERAREAIKEMHRQVCVFV